MFLARHPNASEHLSVTRLCTIVQVNDKILASAADDKMIIIWNIDYDDVNAVFSGHDDKVYALIVVNDKIISGSRDKTVKIWISNSKECF